MLSKGELEDINTSCERCFSAYRHVERDAGLVTIGRIEYIAERDLRIVEELTNHDMHLVEYVDLAHSMPYTICRGCMEMLHYEVSEEAVAQIAEDCDVEIGDVLEDPDSFGIVYPLIFHDMFMVDSEPDICSGCETPFADGEVIVTLTLVDLLDAEPVPVERRHYDSTTTFLCQNCGSLIDSLQ